MDKFLQLEDAQCMAFEQRLLKNGNDFKEYINYLRNTLSDEKYETLVFLYLRLIFNYNHGDVLIGEFWGYYINVLKINNENYTNFIGDDILDMFNGFLDGDGLVKMMNIFIANSLTTLFDYNFNKLIQILDFENSKYLFEELIINEIENMHYEDHENQFNSKQYPQFFKLDCLFSKILRFDKESLQSDSWLSSYILKYIILLQSKNKLFKEKRDILLKLLLATNSCKDLALYFKKIEHDNIQFLYFKIWEMEKEGTDLRELNKFIQLTSEGNKFLSKASYQDIAIIRKLIIGQSANKDQFKRVVDSIVEDLDNISNLSEFQEMYDILIYIFKLNCKSKKFNKLSVDQLETNVKLYKFRKIECQLKRGFYDFNNWRAYLVLNKYNKNSIERCLKSLDFNAKNETIANLQFNELGELWIKYANFYESEVNLLRIVIKMCFGFTFKYWNDFELIVAYWLSFEIKNNSAAELIRRIVKYPKIVNNSKDNFNNLLSKSFKVWDICLKNIDDDLKLDTFEKMSSLKLVKPETIALISNHLLNNDNFNLTTWLKIWENSMLVDFKDYNYIVKNLYNNFKQQLSDAEISIKNYTKYSIKKNILQNIIHASADKFKNDWIVVFLELLIDEEDDKKAKIYLMNKIIFDNIQVLKSHVLLVKWIELLSNMEDVSMDMEFLLQIRTKQFPLIIKLFPNDVLITSNFFKEYIRFESSYKLNEQRIRDIYTFAVALLPFNFNDNIEELWNDFQDFELKNGHLKDFIKLKKELASKFRNMGYIKKKDDKKQVVLSEYKSDGIQFVSGGLVNANKKQKTEKDVFDVQVKEEEEKEEATF
ncbi:hypothetical protein QEN19_001631 [Hanseniaspora menglaensis]